MTEQELIQRYFRTDAGQNVLVGIGDDAAMIQTDKPIVMSLDSLVVGQHFKADDKPRDIGYKALAVNLSDIAAMGAVPRWAMLSLSLPTELGEAWVAEFAGGFLNLAAQWEVVLIGGDMVRGPLVISVQISGEVHAKKPLLRSGAEVGDGIYMTGNVGNAGFAWHRREALTADTHAAEQCLQSLHHPIPRIIEGQILSQYATAAIDISDGVLLDLSRLLDASNKGGRLNLDKIILGKGVAALLKEEDWLLPLTTGDDYELLFTMPEECETQLRSAIAKYGTEITRIGRVTADLGLRCIKNDVEIPLPTTLGFDHFGNGTV